MDIVEMCMCFDYYAAYFCNNACCRGSSPFPHPHYPGLLYLYSILFLILPIYLSDSIYLLQYLEEKYDEEMKKYENTTMPRPSYW